MLPRALRCCTCLLILAVAGLARAESELRLPVPEHFGAIPAVTYDEHGDAVGDARVTLEHGPGGNIWLEAESGITGGSHNLVSAELAVVEGGERLQLVRQRSQSSDETGQPLGVLEIDHLRREALCIPAPNERAGDARSEPERLALPMLDRVANVPLNLLFLPLVEGKQERVAFQILLCRGGPRLLDARAIVASRTTPGEGQAGDLVEIRYELDLPALVAAVARPFLPRLSFWFDSREAGDWIGHRMPLYAKGPTVLVVRSGVSPRTLGLH